MFIDTHCHLPEEADTYMNLAKINDVNKIIASCCDMRDLKFYLNNLNQYSNLYMALGIHPEYAEEASDSDLDLIEKTVKANNKIVAIGEIGLDYHYGKETKVKQLDLFEKQLRLAKRRNLPVVIHSRDATEDTYNLLKEYGVRGVIHCFSGSYEMAKNYIDLGFFLGIGGVVTFKNSKLYQVIEKAGLNNIVLETDSPYLTPEPYRGEINSSKNIVFVAKYIADILKISVEEVAQITSKNAIALFDL